MDKLWFKARRVISVLLVFAMLASITPVQAFAEDTAPVETAAADAMPEESVPSEPEQGGTEQAPAEAENNDDEQVTEEAAESPAPETDPTVPETAPEETVSDEAPAVTGEQPQEQPEEQPEEQSEEDSQPAAEVEEPTAAPEAEAAAEPEENTEADAQTDAAVTVPAEETAPAAPSVSLRTLEASAGNTAVSVTAELPADVQVVVTEMNGDSLGDDNMQALMEAVNSNDIREIEAYDITLADAQGNEYTLPEGQSASVTLSGIALPGEEGLTLYAAHLKADGSADRGTVNGSDVTFTVNSFSPFVVAAVGNARPAAAEEPAPEEPAADPEEAARAAEAGTYAAEASAYSGQSNYFTNSTTDLHVHIYYSKDGKNIQEILPGDTISLPEITEKTAKQDLVGIEFYIAVDEYFEYGMTTFTGIQAGDVYSIDHSSVARLSASFGLFNSRKYTVDFSQAISQAKKRGATYAFYYQDKGLSGGSVGSRTFAVTTNQKAEFAIVTYHNTQSQASQVYYYEENVPASLWSGTSTSLDWLSGENNTRLVGWSKTPGGSKVYDLSQKITPKENMDLYTVWEKATVTVTYDLNGGSWGDLNAPSDTPNKGEAYTISNQKPTRDGYVFQGWMIEGQETLYQPGQKIPAEQMLQDVRLTASWKNARSYTLTVTLSTESGTVLRQEEKTVGWDILDGYKEMAGYVLANTVLGTQFTGDSGVGEAVWTPTVSEETTTYQVAVTIGDHSAELVTVAYAANGGTGNLPEKVTLLRGDAYTVEPCDLTKTDHAFTGWLNSADHQTYNAADEDSKTIAHVDTDITLTAQWEQTVFHIRYQVSPEKSGTLTSYSEDVGVDAAARGSAARAEEGWRFVNWTDETGTEVETDATLTPGEVSADRVYMANFARQTEITVKASDLQKTYDGQAIDADNGVELTAGTLADGHSLQATTTVTPGVINVGQTGTHSISDLKVVDADGNDVSYLYHIAKETGTLTITPKTVTVTAENKSKTYGEADPELTAVVNGVLGEDTVEYTLRREEGTDVGSYTIHATGEKTQGNYQVTWVDGTFYITARPVTITARDAYKLAGAADPDYKAAFGAEVTNAAAGETLDFTIVRTNAGVEAAGQYPDVLAVLLEEDSAVNSNYDITTVNGNLTIFADEKGKADPETPTGETGDGIPDSFQTIFRYISAGNGTVTGQVYEVYTADNWQESWQTAAKPVVQPKAETEVSPADGYTFRNFTADRGGSWADVQAVRSMAATDLDTVFTANFTLRTDLSYTVRYLEDGTAGVLAGEKTVGGQAFGTTVTETAPDIAGYTLTSDKNPQSITIGTGENVITFYYKAVGEMTAVTVPTASPAPLTASAAASPAAPAATAPSPAPAPTAAPEEAGAEEEPEQIPDQETPLAPEAGAEESIGEEETPLAGSNNTWALLNLVLAVLTALGGVLLVLGYLLRRKRNAWRLASLVPAVAAVAAFLLTEDVSRTMAFADKWTMLMVILAVIQIVIAVLSMKDREEPEDDDRADA